MLPISCMQPSQRHNETCSARSSSWGSTPLGDAGTLPEVSEETSEDMSSEKAVEARRLGGEAGGDGEEYGESGEEGVDMMAAGGKGRKAGRAGRRRVLAD